MKLISNIIINYLKYLLNIQVFYQILLIQFGGFIIGLILYNRLRTRIPKELPITLSENNILLYLFLIFILFFLFSFILYNLVIKSKKISYDDNIINRIKQFYNDSLNTFYTFINNLFAYFSKKTLYDIFKPIINVLLTYLFFPRLLFILFNIIPRFIIIIFFLNDIFIFEKLHYFYIALSLLFLPLSIRFFMYVIEDNINLTLKDAKEKLCIYTDEYNINNDLMPPTDIKYFFQQLMLIKLNIRKNVFTYDLNITFDFADRLYKEFNLNVEKEQLNIPAITNYYESKLKALVLEGSFHYLYSQSKQLLLPWLNLLTLGTYLMGWIYIVYTSINLLPQDYFAFLEYFCFTQEPFTEIYYNILFIDNNENF